jgi:Sensors of blue-light using FAD
LTAVHHQLLYVSHLVSGARYDVFAAICRVSRKNNAERALSGVLLFDGHRFCQLLEGPEESLAQTRQSIVGDPRHEFMTPLVDRPLAGATTLDVWQAGYCEADDLDVLIGPERLGDDRTMAAFRAIVSRADLSP